MNPDLPPFLKEMLASPPQAGAGVHHWLYCVARQLHAHLPAPEIVDLLEERVAHCGRHVPRREIVAAVRNSIATAWQPGGHAASPAPVQARWPEVNQTARAEIIAQGAGLVDLWESSKPPIAHNQPHTEGIIDHLFPGNPLLCCGLSSTVFDTRPREQWRGQLNRLSLIVPSPMIAHQGRTQDGRMSAHTLDNTGPRRFLVCEFDSGTMDEQAALLLHLASLAPMVCAVHSGGKSLHGWFLVQGHPEEKIEGFFRYAVALGADRATWTRSQFVRMPDGLRGEGQRQTLYFVNLNLLK
jgi:hypothetical protein